MAVRSRADDSFRGPSLCSPVAINIYDRWNDPEPLARPAVFGHIPFKTTHLVYFLPLGLQGVSKGPDPGGEEEWT